MTSFPLSRFFLKPQALRAIQAIYDAAGPYIGLFLSTYRRDSNLGLERTFSPAQPGNPQSKQPGGGPDGRMPSTDRTWSHSTASPIMRLGSLPACALLANGIARNCSQLSDSPVRALAEAPAMDSRPSVREN